MASLGRAGAPRSRCNLDQVVWTRWAAHRPVVRLVPVDATPGRTFGTMRNLVVPDDFDAPLPADELAAWDQ